MAHVHVFGHKKICSRNFQWNPSWDNQWRAKIVKILYSAKCTQNHKFILNLHTKNYLWIYDLNKFLQNHQRHEGGISIWFVYWKTLEVWAQLMLQHPQFFGASTGIVRDHLQIILSKSETERFFHFVWLQNPFHNLKRFICYRNVSPCKRISVTKICFSLKLQKKCYKTKPFQNRSVRKAFHFTNATDSF
jgi:hypothetical protein